MEKYRCVYDDECGIYLTTNEIWHSEPFMMSCSNHECFDHRDTEPVSFTFSQQLGNPANNIFALKRYFELGEHTM